MVKTGDGRSVTVIAFVAESANMKNIIPAIFAMALALPVQAKEFYAYFTTLDYVQPAPTGVLNKVPLSAAKAFRRAGVSGTKDQANDAGFKDPRPGNIRWGKYADLVVNLSGKRQLVFSRATGYLPYLKTPKGQFPLKQLIKCSDDPMCLCSYVRLIEDHPERIIVHWRHVPNPARVVMTETIHEYFTITPEGKVKREVRAGTPKLDDFNDPANVTVQELNLQADGISELSLRRAKPSGRLIPAVTGSPIRQWTACPSAAWFRFDDGLKPNRDQATEAVKGKPCPVSGNKTLWKKGVSGTALGFDGYFSKVTLPREMTPRVTEELTLEAWVALGAYPWNDAGIVHRSSGEPITPQQYKHGYRDPYVYHPWKMTGYFLGVDPYGRPIFKVNGNQVGGGEVQDKQTVPQENVLPTYQWAHLAGTYGKGKMSLYINGKLVASMPASGAITVPERDLLIGLNGDPQRISDPVSHSKFAANNNLPLVYGIEGLIDEVKVFDRALSAKEIRQSYQAIRPRQADVGRPDLEKRVLPGQVKGKPAKRFGASLQTLKYHDLWDNLWRPGKHRDIVVRFDALPCSVVFWQGTNFGSGWVTDNNKWMSDQSWEIGGPHGCAEHMADKRGRFNRVSLVENTDARVVVHWRYASIDVGYVFPGIGVWADEYYTIYPDGVAVRCVEGIGGGWQDTQFLSQPGTTCLDNVDLTALTVANMDGNSADLTWALPNRVPANPLKDACIKRINFKSKWKVFDVYRSGVSIGTWGAQEQSRHTGDPFAGPWNHWPVGLNPSDGRYAVSNDRVTHAALGGARGTGNIIIYGFTDQPTSSLASLAKSWNHPPMITETRGCESKGYDQPQRAYLLTGKAGPMSFALKASKDSPIHNPCFVIEGWDSENASRVTINGQKAKPSKAFRQGIVRNAGGKTTMIIWLALESGSPVKLEISEEEGRPADSR